MNSQDLILRTLLKKGRKANRSTPVLAKNAIKADFQPQVKNRKTIRITKVKVNKAWTTAKKVLR
jgi:hypothetical protein